MGNDQFPSIKTCRTILLNRNFVFCSGHRIRRSDDQTVAGRPGVRVQPGTARLLSGRVVGPNRRELRDR